MEAGRHRSTIMWYMRIHGIMLCQHIDAWYESQKDDWNQLKMTICPAAALVFKNATFKILHVCPFKNCLHFHMFQGVFRTLGYLFSLYYRYDDIFGYPPIAKVYLCALPDTFSLLIPSCLLFVQG
ncbi:hypothetical protein [Bacillus sp. 37MA]|uniref:hypothetical protein n=1 Tax=Bacillus sp. 37MA TaxID=1132442 RepID=UPI0018CBCEBA|nr:hypothetical protein [Bacillus sp. 37MA]